LIAQGDQSGGLSEKDAEVDCSVIIPAYNAAAFIGAAIADALGQSDLTVEVLVVDDCSTDQTAAVVAGLGDPRLVYVRQDRNGGPARARNVGLDRSRGRWVSILDADDRIQTHRLSQLIARAETNHLDVVSDNLWVEQGGRRSLHIPETLDGRLTMLSLTDLFDGSRMGQKRPEYGYLKPLFRSSFIARHGLRYDETLRIGEDLMFVADCLVRGGRYGRVSTCDYTYVKHEESISHRLKPGQVEAMIEADARFLRLHGSALDPGQRVSVLAHMRNLNSAAAYIRMLEAIKQGSAGALASELVRHPAAAVNFREPLEIRLRRLFSRAPRPPLSKGDRSVRPQKRA
jgi:succinoglycan biosynthesis protein ExoO